MVKEIKQSTVKVTEVKENEKYFLYKTESNGNFSVWKDEDKKQLLNDLNSNMFKYIEVEYTDDGKYKNFTKLLKTEVEQPPVVQERIGQAVPPQATAPIETSVPYKGKVKTTSKGFAYPEVSVTGENSEEYEERLIDCLAITQKVCDKYNEKYYSLQAGKEDAA